MNITTRSTRAAGAIAAACAAAALAGIGPAAAAGPTGDLIAGRARIMGTVNNTGNNQQLDCKLNVDGYTPFSTPLSVGPNSTKSLVLSNVSKGGHTTTLNCTNHGTTTKVLAKMNVLTVEEANPTKDSIERTLAGFGSSSMVTDKALVP